MKRKKITALLFLLGVLPVSGCVDKVASPEEEQGVIPSAQKGVYQKITPEEARRMMEGPDSYILLDVRTEEEFKESHIEGAILLPDDQIREKSGDSLKDKDALILVYCRSGRRSAGAAKALIEMGYTNVYDFGGIIDWPYGTVSGD